MWDDPIVEETRAAGAKIARACGYDIRRMAAFFRKNEKEFAERIRAPGHVVRVKGKRRPVRRKAQPAIRTKTEN